jgi:hypothetical protein
MFLATQDSWICHWDRGHFYILYSNWYSRCLTNIKTSACWLEKQYAFCILYAWSGASRSSLSLRQSCWAQRHPNLHRVHPNYSGGDLHQLLSYNSHEKVKQVVLCGKSTNHLVEYSDPNPAWISRQYPTLRSISDFRMCYNTEPRSADTSVKG